MVNAEILSQLNGFARSHPHIVIARLKKGNEVRKSAGLSYIIDNVSAHDEIGKFAKGVVPYGPIHRHFAPQKGAILALFGNARKTAFSRAVKQGVGECLEKAVAVQLFAQRGNKSFLINGVAEFENEVGCDYHAFNVVFRQGKPFLVDAQNPLAKDKSGNITHPYIAPITEITPQGEIKVEKEWVQGRRYSLT